MLERLFFQRPRILDLLHRIRLVNATSQTNSFELAGLARYASGAICAVEIGSYQGVSAGQIAASLAPGGTLFCIDPWPAAGKTEDPNFIIFQRHIARTRNTPRIQVLRGRTADVAENLPRQVDFAFIDGDHSWHGIETDWRLISPLMNKGAVVCLHDTAIPPAEPWRMFDSVRFYDARIARDPRFDAVETIHSMRVIRRNNSG